MKRLKEQLAQTQEEGDQLEKETGDVWKAYEKENVEREKKRAEAVKRRSVRMKNLQDAFGKWEDTEGSAEGFDEWTKRKGYRSPPSFEERFNNEMPHFKRLLEKLKRSAGRGRFDAELESRRWSDFQRLAESKGELGLDDIPIPEGSGLVCTMDQKDFREMAKRYHPDKFMQKYGRKLKEDDAEAILETVVAVFQRINAAYSR